MIRGVLVAAGATSIAGQVADDQQKPASRAADAPSGEAKKGEDDQGRSLNDPAPHRTCTETMGVTVCRNAQPAVMGETVVAAVKRPADASKEGSVEGGVRIVLLDIPSDILSRLADDPNNNRKFLPRDSWDYHAPSGQTYYADIFSRAFRDLKPDTPGWEYHPKASFVYHPKESWGYDRDVFGRLWRENIRSDTRILIEAVEP